MAIKQLSIEEANERVKAVANALDDVVGDIKAKTFDVNISDEEVNALIVGAIDALVTVSDFYLGDMDEKAPNSVREARESSDNAIAAWIIATAVKGYSLRFLAEDGDEQ